MLNDRASQLWLPSTILYTENAERNKLNNRALTIKLSCAIAFLTTALTAQHPNPAWATLNVGLSGASSALVNYLLDADIRKGSPPTSLYYLFMTSLVVGVTDFIFHYTARGDLAEAFTSSFNMCCYIFSSYFTWLDYTGYFLWTNRKFDLYSHIILNAAATFCSAIFFYGTEEAKTTLCQIALWAFLSTSVIAGGSYLYQLRQDFNSLHHFSIPYSTIRDSEVGTLVQAYEEHNQALDEQEVRAEPIRPSRLLVLQYAQRISEVTYRNNLLTN